MKSNKIKFGLLLLVSLITINTASANPGFNVVVTPMTNTVAPGGTATFSLTITAMDTLSVEEFADLSVIDLNGNPISWNTRFNNNLFLIGPYSDPTKREKTVILEIDIPAGTPVGEYHQKVKGDGFLPDPFDPTQPDRLLGSIESSDFPITVSVTQVPEFPTIAMPIISALGIMLFMARQKGKKEN